MQYNGFLGVMILTSLGVPMGGQRASSNLSLLLHKDRFLQSFTLGSPGRQSIKCT